ncbi:MAG TPA: molybdenum cofactor biosynthesis protein MoaE [Terracidiphilus sp.]|jgi:molybdopterin synthase catalytic subunit|nr:molybdenum cofactor biosynthesis protein MoaE [Terracidiphilus sp.]
MLLNMNRVKVLAFGVLRESLGREPLQMDLAEGATVGDLLDELGRAHPSVTLRGIAVSVNAEYARATQPLASGDEVGLLPPVSGGIACSSPLDEGGGKGAGKVLLMRDVIDASALLAAAKQGEDGAVTMFDGIVRNNSRGRQTLYLDYEAYEEMALKQMAELCAQAREKFGVRHATIVHRLGRLEIGETSVLIVVASAHRGAAFDACRWIIDTLKKTVPIWKKETFVDGAVWSDGEPFPDDVRLDESAVAKPAGTERADGS